MEDEGSIALHLGSRDDKIRRMAALGVLSAATSAIGCNGDPSRSEMLARIADAAAADLFATAALVEEIYRLRPRAQERSTPKETAMNTNTKDPITPEQAIRVLAETPAHEQAIRVLASAVAEASRRGEWYDSEHSTNIFEWIAEGDFDGSETVESLAAEWDE